MNEYIYVKVIEDGDPSGSRPAFTDSARVTYQGRLIPSKTYPEGKVFDGTVYGTYNAKTNANEEKVRSLLQAKGEIAGMVAEAAAKIVTGSDSPENDKELYDRFLEKAGVRGK